MTNIPFHATRIGQRFYEHTAPELVRQLSRLNENLVRLAEAAEQKDESDDQGKEAHEKGNMKLGSEDPQATDP